MQAPQQGDGDRANPNKKPTTTARKKFLLSEKTRNLFSDKLDSLPGDRKSDLFKMLAQKIDGLMSKSSSESLK